MRSASLAARTLRYWVVDPRLNMNLVFAVIFPIIGVLMGRVGTEDHMSQLLYTGIFLYLVPITSGMAVGALMQYDSTGAWIVVSSGMSGREERRGRLVGSLIVLVPQVIGYLIHDVVVGVSDVDFVFHQVMGVVLFSGAAATTLVVNARWVYPVQPPGVSPMATKGTGSFLMTMLLQLIGFAGGRGSAAALLCAHRLGVLRPHSDVGCLRGCSAVVRLHPGGCRARRWARLGSLRGGRAHHDSQLAGKLISFFVVTRPGLPIGVPRPRPFVPENVAAWSRCDGR